MTSFWVFLEFFDFLEPDFYKFFAYFLGSHSPANGGPHDPMSAIEMTRLALLKMYGASPPVSLPNLPPLPGLPADILQQAQQQQEKAMNLHLQQQKSAEDFASRVRESERLKTSEADDEEEAVETAEDEEPEPVVKKSSENHTSILENENSLSPIPSKKRHRSNDSDDEVEVSSPKKQQTLGLPGVNIKMANRGTSCKNVPLKRGKTVPIKRGNFTNKKG